MSALPDGADASTLGAAPPAPGAAAGRPAPRPQPARMRPGPRSTRSRGHPPPGCGSARRRRPRRGAGPLRGRPPHPRMRSWARANRAPAWQACFGMKQWRVSKRGRTSCAPQRSTCGAAGHVAHSCRSSDAAQQPDSMTAWLQSDRAGARCLLCALKQPMGSMCSCPQAQERPRTPDALRAGRPSCPASFRPQACTPPAHVRPTEW